MKTYNMSYNIRHCVHTAPTVTVYTHYNHCMYTTRTVSLIVICLIFKNLDIINEIVDILSVKDIGLRIKFILTLPHDIFIKKFMKNYLKNLS